MNTPEQDVVTTATDVVPAHADEPHADPPVENPGGVRTAVIIVAVILLLAIAYGLHLRSTNEKTLSIATAESAVPTVNVIHPAEGSQAGDLVLPGNVQAFTDTPIYSRTNGYLKKWYFDIGSHVRKGDLLAEIETPEIDQQLDQSRAELERMQANADLAGVTSNRWQALLAKHAVSQQESDQTRANYIAAQAAVDASKANVRRLEQLQSYERIVAPFDGIITARNTDIGDLIDAGSGAANPRELFHLAAISKLRVFVAVPEVNSDSIQDGDTATLTRDFNPDEKISGKIVRNADAIDHSTRTLNVEVDVDNSKGVLRPGAYVFVHFHLPANGNAVTIPSNALLFRAEGLQVGVVRGERVQLVPVTVGHDFGSSVEITSGLTAADEVILNPADSLATGLQVRPEDCGYGGQIMIEVRATRAAILLLAAGLGFGLSGCMVGPKYVRPAAPLAPEFKEPLPGNFKSEDGWKPAQPSDAKLKGDWWTLFNDPQLNALETQIDPANQTLKQAEANFRAARAAVRFNRASEAPTIGVAPGVGAVRNSNNQPYLNVSGANNGKGDFDLPFDLNYEIDLWGRIRRTVTQAREEAQASAADLETSRLSLHAELAADYFNLRSADAQRKLLNDTVTVFQSALQLTEDRYNGGASPLSDVTQARTQLQTAQVQATDVDTQRAMYEHAIAVLIGKPPAVFSLPPNPITVGSPTIPSIPGMLPSQLLERRPDIASMERSMAAANEQIGIAQTAYYPTLSLSTAVGFLGTSAINWLSWPSRFFAVGPMLSQTLFDNGRRRATSDIALAQYDGAVASYRQTTLTAFQQVEDNLNALHNLEIESRQQHDATASAQQSLDLFNTRYEGGVDTYLQVITWQTSLLQNQRNDIEIMRRRFEASVLLVKALGGGWDATQLPQKP